MEAQSDRIGDEHELPVWSAEAGAVTRVRARDLTDAAFRCIVTNKIGRLQEVTVQREDISVAGERFLDAEGRQILAIVTSRDHLAACRAALSPKTESFASVGASLITQKKLDVGASQGAKEKEPEDLDPRTLRAQFERNWFNCGRTAVCLQNELRALGAKLTTTRRVYTTDDYDAFLGIFGKKHEKPILLDCSFINVHTFTLEIHPSCSYLVQGYQMRYSAFWWQGIGERPQDMSLSAEATLPQREKAAAELAATREHRDRMGRGLALDLDTVGTYVLVPIRELLKQKQWTKRACEIWQTMPFFVGEKALVGDIEFVVSQVVVENPETLYERLGGKAPQSICGLIVSRALAQYEAILKRIAEG